MKAIYTVFRLIPAAMSGRFFAVSGLAILVALLETMGVASIMPFVAMLTDPEAFQRSIGGSPIGKLLPAEIALLQVHEVGVVVLVLFVATNVASLLSLWVSIRFASTLGITLSRGLAVGYFRKGFLFLQQQGTGVLANDVTREVEKLAACSILQLYLLMAKLIQVVFITGLLAAVSPQFMLIFSVGTVSLYVALYLSTRKRVDSAGKEAVQAAAASSKRAHELFAASRDMLVGHHAAFFISRISEESRRLFRADAVSRLAPVIPKYLIELVAFTALLSVPIYRSYNGQEYQSVVPVITLFAYAGYRILPAIQQFYGSYSLLKFYDPLASRIADAIEWQDETVLARQDEVSGIGSALCFEGVSYSYPGQATTALNSFDLTISPGDRIAVIGPSGAGKSTFLDVLLGLLPITSGSIRIGDHVFVQARIPWAAGAIGYVPQSPLIIGATIAENIALGVPLARIDLDRCRSIARTACVDDVVERLPQGYLTVVGGGVSLSGGEIQRLAIARALYNQSPLLVMDEPSSALDPMIATRLFDNLCSLNDDQALVVVTHDWDLLPRFNWILMVDSGRVVAAGRPNEMSPLIDDLRTRLSELPMMEICGGTASSVGS